MVIGLLLAVGSQKWAAENAAGKALYDAGRIREAVSTLERSRADALDAEAPDLEVARILDTLGAAYEKAGRLADARKAFDWTLNIRRAKLKSPSEEVAISLTNESTVYWAMVKADRSMEFASQARQMWEDLGFNRRREYFIALNNLISACLLQGSIREVEPVVAKARVLYAKEIAPADPMLPGSLSALATAYKALGRYNEAGELAEQALVIARAQKASPSLLAELSSNLGDIRMTQGRLAEAKEILRESVTGTPGEAELDVVNKALAYRSLGIAERRGAEYGRAEADNKRALQLLGSRHGQADVARGEVYSELGLIAEEQSHWKEAETYLNQAVQTLEQAFGPAHASISPTYCNLAALYVERHQYRKAEAIYKQVLATDTAVLPAEHPAIARDLNNLGSLEFHRKHYQAAYELFSKASALLERTIGADHPETATAEANLGNTLLALKRYPEAQVEYEQALRSFERCWGPDDPRLMAVLNALAVVSRAQAEPGRAETLETRMERIRVREAIKQESGKNAGTS